MKTFLNNMIKGIVIGAGAILPGISSGVMCVIFGIYEKLINSILYFFRNIKENLKFLAPFVIGGMIGVLLFSNILSFILNKYPLQTKALFIGLILGSLPQLIKEINTKEKFKVKNLIYTVISFAIGIAIVLLERKMPAITIENISAVYLIIAGFAMSIGVVIPGVSSTIILMLFGVYGLYIDAVASLNMPILVPFGIGLVMGGIVFMVFIKYLINKYYAKTFYSIIGFTLGSIFVLMPEISGIFELIIFIICIILGSLSCTRKKLKK